MNDVIQYIRRGKERKYIGKAGDKDIIVTEKAPAKGVMVAHLEGEKVIIGASLCSPVDEFNPARGKDIAIGMGRAYFDNNEKDMFEDIVEECTARFPHSIRGEVRAFVERCRRVNAFKSKAFPVWAK